jgi:hypothetical protein
MKPKTGKILVGPLKVTDTISVTVNTKVKLDVEALLSDKNTTIQKVVVEFIRRLALQDPSAMAFIAYSTLKKTENKEKTEYSFEFAKEIDTDALYNLIEGSK